MGTSNVPYYSEILTEELKLQAEICLNEYETTRNEKCKELRDLLKQETNLKLQEDDTYLLKFLRARKFHVQEAAKLCKNYFKIKKGKLFGPTDYDVLIKEIEEHGRWGFLPYRDPSGCAIAYFETEPWDPEKLPLKPALKCWMLHYMSVMESPVSQIAGFKFIADFSGMSLKHLMAFASKDIWDAFRILQTSIPGRYKEIHIVNENRIFGSFWAILRPVLKQKLRDRFFFHGKNYEALHKKIPPEILPESCGGILGPYVNTDHVQYLRSLTKRFEEMDKYGYQTEQTMQEK